MATHGTEHVRKPFSFLLPEPDAFPLTGRKYYQTQVIIHIKEIELGSHALLSHRKHGYAFVVTSFPQGLLSLRKYELLWEIVPEFWLRSFFFPVKMND